MPELAPLDRLRALLAQTLRATPASLRPDAHVMDELGADSLQFLDYVAAVEREFGIQLKGSDSEKFATLKKGAAFLEKTLPSAAPVAETPAPAPAAVVAHAAESLRLDAAGNLHHAFEVGMPMTGRNNLGETPLLKLIGDLRWKHVELFSGLPSKDLCDDTGERLYATFFYVEANFDESEPLAAFGENDRLRIVSSLRSSGGSILDGYHRLMRDDGGSTCNDALGVEPPPKPYFRTSNIFVKMLDGAQWLKKSKPCQPGMAAIPASSAPPDTADWCRQADADDRFEAVPTGWRSLSPTPLEDFYDIVPDRDLNGAGLLYFANYPQILDIVERRLLENALPVPFEPRVADRRATIRRRSAYLSNASQSDRIRVTTEIAARDPLTHPAILGVAAEAQPIHLWFNYVMRRCSDDRKMMVCTVRKTITGLTWGETGILSRLTGSCFGG
jgi:acyl carrier protein